MLWIDARLHNGSPRMLRGSQYGNAYLVDTWGERRLGLGGTGVNREFQSPWGGGTHSGRVVVGPHDTETYLFADASSKPFVVPEGIVFKDVVISFEVEQRGHACTYVASLSQ